MCNCHSYNWEVGQEPNVILEAPEWSHKDTICIDACIASIIQHLWDNGIVTLNSCCGHNKKNPSIVLTESISENYANAVRRIISEVDDREFTLYSWKLTEV
jgi:hypothetical protein